MVRIGSDNRIRRRRPRFGSRKFGHPKDQFKLDSTVSRFPRDDIVFLSKRATGIGCINISLENAGTSVSATPTGERLRFAAGNYDHREKHFVFSLYVKSAFRLARVKNHHFQLFDKFLPTTGSPNTPFARATYGSRIGGFIDCSNTVLFGYTHLASHVRHHCPVVVITDFCRRIERIMHCLGCYRRHGSRRRI